MSTLIPLDEAARQLNCSPTHLMRLARRREVPGAKVGKKWTFLQDDLVELVRRRTQVQLADAKRGRRRNEAPRL